MKLPGIQKETLYLLGALAAAGVAFYIVKKLPAVGKALNPTSDQNLANRALVGTYQTLTGSERTPGSDLAGLTETLGSALDGVRGISDLERGAEILLDDTAARQSCNLALTRDYGGDKSMIKTDRCKKLLAVEEKSIGTRILNTLFPWTAAL